MTRPILPGDTATTGTSPASYLASAACAVASVVGPTTARTAGSSASSAASRAEVAGSPLSSTALTFTVNGASPRALNSATASRSPRSWALPDSRCGPLRSPCSASVCTSCRAAAGLSSFESSSRVAAHQAVPAPAATATAPPASSRKRRLPVGRASCGPDGEACSAEAWSGGVSRTSDAGSWRSSAAASGRAVSAAGTWVCSMSGSASAAADRSAISRVTASGSHPPACGFRGPPPASGWSCGPPSASGWSCGPPSAACRFCEPFPAACGFRGPPSVVNRRTSSAASGRRAGSFSRQVSTTSRSSAGTPSRSAGSCTAR